MELSTYGLLIGKITASRPKRPGSPHWLLIVQPGNPEHPAYRIAVNLQSTERGKTPELQYQIVNFDGRATAAANTLIRTLKRLGMTPDFVTAASQPSVPRLDFVRGGFIDPRKFADLRPGSKTLEMEFKKALAEARKAGALIAVFGTGAPTDARSGASVPTGFTGIENIHMNQGAKNLINGEPHYVENAPNQDGGIIFLLPTGARGFFVKFNTQTTVTDKDGNPAETGIKELDKTSAEIRKAIMPLIGRKSMAARRSDARTSAKHAAKSRPASTIAK